MPRTAVLFIDHQVDFLDSKQGRMPVGDKGAELVLAAAQLVISCKVLSFLRCILLAIRDFIRNDHEYLIYQYVKEIIWADKQNYYLWGYRD